MVPVFSEKENQLPTFWQVLDVMDKNIHTGLSKLL